MQDTVRCPSCKAILRVPPVVPEGDVSCPRCLALVPLPRTEIATAGIQAEPTPPAPVPTPFPAVPPATPEPTSAARPHCPHCGKEVQEVWLFCPHCEEPLKTARHPTRRRTADQDVKRDGTAAATMVGLLAILGGIGIFWYFGMALSQRQPDALFGGVLILLLAGLVSTGIMFFRTRHNPTKRTFGRVVVGTLSLIGMVIAGGCTLVTAFLVFAFIACLSGGMRF